MWKGQCHLKYLIFIFPERRDHAMPCRATWGSTRVGQEAEGASEKRGPEPLLWFLWGKGIRGSERSRVWEFEQV